jgi:hypothetical protein
MTIEAAFDDLTQKCCELRTALRYLEVFLGDKPHSHQLVDSLGELAADMWSRADQATAAAGEAALAVRPAFDRERALRALATCQEQYNAVQHSLIVELVSDQRLLELQRLGRRLGGEWKGWAGNLQPVLSQCLPALHGTSQALFCCWQEIAEHAGTNHVSVQTINVGHQTVTPVRVVTVEG